MEIQHITKNKININVLDLFEKLCDKDPNIRLKACANILRIIWTKQQEVENEVSKDLEYCIDRLVKGLASSREAARLGYTLLLTELLRRFAVILIEEVIDLMQKHLCITGKQDKRDVIFGQLFGYTAIIRSGRLLNHNYLPSVVVSLIDLLHGKNYILNATYEIILNIFTQLTSENFKVLWPHLKKKLPSDWETCSAESLWLLLLCIRLFPDIISSKYMVKHWGHSDIFASENLSHFQKLLKQTTSSLPKLHPLCIEFLLLMKQRKNFHDIWTVVIDDNLFAEHNEKSFVGFEMIKVVLQDSPSRKILKTVFSPKFRIVFSKSFLNSKHAMNSAANNLANFLCAFVKNNAVPEKQIIVLKAFLQPPGTVLLDQILKMKEVSLIIQSLLPDAVKNLCEFLKTVLLEKKSDENDFKEVNNMKRFQATQQIANLVAHPVMLGDLEWRMDVIRFLFLHSFFVIKETTSEIPHCEKIFEPLSDDLRESCMNAFYRSVNSLHVRIDNNHSSVSSFLQQLTNIADYAEQLMNCTEILEPKFTLEKVQNSWSMMKTIVNKLRKHCKKGKDKVNESSAFQILFLHLSLYLFQDPNNIGEILEELNICCKKFMKSDKHECNNVENGDAEPPWIGVVIDILLSLLSKSSNLMRSLVTYIFPLFCSFVDEAALQQILDVINPQESNEDMLMDENASGDEDEQVDFASGSSEESEDETGPQKLEPEFAKKMKEALGAAADSDAESVVLSDSDMFKLDSAISAVFKSRAKSGHTQVKSEEKALNQFRLRCLDLLMIHLKTEPPMKLVLNCIEPLLFSVQSGHQNKHQKAVLSKSTNVLQFLSKLRKFQDHNNVSKSELKRLLDLLITMCHKEINMFISQKLSCLCVFIVLCYRKIKTENSPEKTKKSKTPSYLKAYHLALDAFVSSGSSHMLPHFFTHLMAACPDVAWYFIEPLKSYVFNNNTRLFRQTQCLGLLSECLKYSKNQKEITNSEWVDLENSILSPAVENLKSALESENIKHAYVTELLNIIYTIHSTIEEKTNKSVLKKYDILPLLSNPGKLRNMKKARILINKLTVCSGGDVNKSKQLSVKNNSETDDKRTSPELVNTDSVNDGENDNKRTVEELDNTDTVNNKEGLKKKKKKKNQ